MIQTNFKSKLPATEDGKAKKSAKIKNAIFMAYVSQYLSTMAMLNAIFNIQADTGWPTGKACQLFDSLKQRYNPNDKLSRAQMIKKLNEIKSKKREDTNKIKALKVKPRSGQNTR